MSEHIIARVGAMSEDRSARIGRRLVHDGRVVRLSVDTVRFPDGSVGELELVRHRGAAAVLPVAWTGTETDPDVILLRQYRYAAGGVIYEVPAGIIEPGETWEQCAHRELEEEAGLRAGRLLRLTTIHTTPGFTNEQIHLFAAFDLTPGRANSDGDEFLEVVRMPISRAVGLVRSGEISDAKSVIAILYSEYFL